MVIVISILKLALFMLVLVLHPSSEGQLVPLVPVTPFAPRPLCNFQMALANQACAYLPFVQVPPQAPRAPMAPPPPSSDEDGEDHRHGRRHRHDHDHDDDNDNEHDHQHDHKRGHGHKHHHHHRHHRHRDTPIEQQCCKWLSQVDDQCVCELLVRLPPFLARPVHRYSVLVGGSCNITYSCGSRLRV
ncbi:polyadenylate-binding protein 1-B-like [Cynara cardunculus var. scolymus]|uniref:Bifunctional inhibitor/plant lipid transfer protein/seed storage helical domain-containing protein n=1 Tax=Cynara cardunculus var. scolymus TaxID=59895 RepID=A0A103XPC2_CYNCS|nr:polyadenylate-binding protein 1-B-like [Cynara cardunculus var. scolymus]KVH94398.1 hypothetical protein Ccrd_003531 [Cynara cardunculus var. scolymus]